MHSLDCILTAMERGSVEQWHDRSRYFVFINLFILFIIFGHVGSSLLHADFL